MAMLVFDLRTLGWTAVAVHGVLPATDPIWEPQDRVPAEGVRVTGRLSPAGPGRFFFSGRISGSEQGECRRCLVDVETDVTEPVQWLFGEPDTDGAVDDPDVYVFDPRTHELDLRPPVREQWLLSAPAFFQCRDDCPGLCPRCGADLNAGPCECQPSVDDRWAALRGLGSRGETPGSS